MLNWPYDNHSKDTCDHLICNGKIILSDCVIYHSVGGLNLNVDALHLDSVDHFAGLL